MSFSDLLKKPLPSKAATQESTQDPTVPEFKGVEQDYDDIMTPPPGDTKADEPKTITPDLEQPKNVSEDGIESDAGVPVPPMADPVTPPQISDDTPDVNPLSPEESQHVDDVMNSVATPMLISDELSEDEIKEFVEGVDSDIAVAEGFLTERTIVRFDKNAKKAQLYEVAIAAVAREKKDPLYRKLETVYKMERVLKAKLRKKYHSQANAKVKEYLARAKKSKSGILARIANKITGK